MLCRVTAHPPRQASPSSPHPARGALGRRRRRRCCRASWRGCAGRARQEPQPHSAVRTASSVPQARASSCMTTGAMAACRPRGAQPCTQPPVRALHRPRCGCVSRAAPRWTHPSSRSAECGEGSAHTISVVSPPVPRQLRSSRGRRGRVDGPLRRSLPAALPPRERGDWKPRPVRQSPAN